MKITIKIIDQSFYCETFNFSFYLYIINQLYFQTYHNHLNTNHFQCYNLFVLLFIIKDV